MIDFIINTFMLLKITTYYTFVASYKVGYFVIRLCCFSGYYLARIARICAVVLRIALEDFALFITDIAQKLWFTLNLLFRGVDHLLQMLSATSDSFKYIYDTIVEFISTASKRVESFLVNISSYCSNVIDGVKQFLVLFGSGVWFAVTLIPSMLVYFGINCTYFVRGLVIELYNVISAIVVNTVMYIQSIFGFFTDVPLEACMGLIFTICIIYVMSRFYLLLFWYVKLQANSFWIYIRRSSTNIWWVRDENRTKVKEIGKTKRDSEIQVDCCVVCQERQKCIVILDCKHLCMCEECTELVMINQRKCPICRSYIKRRFKVFV